MSIQRSSRSLPTRLASYRNILANNRPVSNLRCFSTTLPSGTLGHEGNRQSYLLLSKQTKFNVKSNLETVLSGLSTTLTNSGVYISKEDPYYVEGINKSLKVKQLGTVPYTLASLVHALETRDAVDAWAQFKRIHMEEMDFVRDLSRQQWSQLFNLLTEAKADPKEKWIRTELIFNAMIRTGHELNPKEFAKLIKIASRVGLGNVVQEIWNGIYRKKVSRSLELWNSYLRATCNADETLWYRKFNGTTFTKLPREPIATNDALNIVSEILADGLSPDSTSYEMVILYLGQKGDLSYASAVVSAVWGIKLDNAPLDEGLPKPVSTGSALYPQVSTLVSIINAYGANGQLVEGLKIMEKMQALYNLPISGDYALHLWEAILKWAYFSSEPWGNTPGIALDAVWTSVVDRHNLKPTGKMFYYKTHRDLVLRNYKAMIEFVPLVLSSHNVKNKSLQASSILYRGTKGLARMGELDACRAALDKWAPVGPQFEQVRENMHRYIATSSKIGKQPPLVLTIEELALAKRALKQSQRMVDVLESWPVKSSDETPFDVALA